MLEIERDPKERVEILLEGSRAQRLRDPQAMVHLAELAREAAYRLDVGHYGAQEIADTRARVWAELGNAYRLADALDRADEAMARAMRYYQIGSRDSRLLALIADRTATVLCHRRRFREALHLLDGIYSIYLAEGDRHLAGRALITLGLYTENIGHAERAVALTCQGLELIEPREEPTLELMAVHNLLLCAVDLGFHELARRLVREVRPLYTDQLALLRLQWVEGKAAAGLGQTGEAEVLLRGAREGFLAQGLVFPASMVALDLALVWTGEGRVQGVRSIAEELVSTFRALRVPRESFMALLLLLDACEREETSAKAVAEAIQIAASTLRTV